MIKTVDDIEKASDAVLRAYLKADGVSFSEDALRPELIADARAHLTKQNAKTEPAKVEVEEEAPLPDETSVAEALLQLDAKGFKSREEIVAYINALGRDRDGVRAEREALADTVKDIELRELQLTEREKTLQTKADEVHADMKKQEDLYEKLAALKQSFPAGTDLNV